MQIIGIIISVVSVLFGFGIMFGYYFIYGQRAMLEGAPGWILSIIGAPTTFLLWFVHLAGLDKNMLLQYIWVCFFFLLQYQLIAFFIYRKFGGFSYKVRFICFISLTFIILISAFIMKNIIIG